MNRNVKRFVESTKLRAENVLTCQRVLRAYKSTCFEYLRAFGKNLGKKFYWYRIYTDTCPAFFIFTSFNTTPLMLLVKIILNRNRKQKVTNLDGLMLLCRQVAVNALVQNKFRSTIHLLSQNLLAQSLRWKHQMNT